MTTLADVAKRANVSKMTVSRVLNHPELVTEELKQLVQLAMKELDYQPNVVAKALAQQRTLTVQVIILEEMEIVEPYYAELIAGIALGLTEKNYTMQIVTEKHQVTDQCDGYIVTGARTSDYSWLKSLNKPVVLLERIEQGYLLLTHRIKRQPIKPVDLQQEKDIIKLYLWESIYQILLLKLEKLDT